LLTQVPALLTPQPPANATPRLSVTPGSGSGPGTGPATGQGAGPGITQTYTVEQGDSLLGIAAKLNVPSGERDAWAQQVRTINGLQGDSIQAGQTLRLPPPTPRN
jgi:LysM repeat protein